MRFKIGYIFILSIAVLSKPASAQRFLIRDGNPNYHIVIGDTTSGSYDRLASDELAHYLHAIAGTHSNKSPRSEQCNIYIGKTIQTSKKLHQRLNQLHDDGFLVYSDSKDLYICGNTEQATIYGVYDFLEHHLGCRFLTPHDEVVPHCDNFTLYPIDEVKNPSFAYRETLYYYPNHSDDYCLKHKLHNRNDMRKQWGMFVHTFRHLIPTDRYFDTHPEWFSQIGGQRVKDGQPCLSDSDMLDELCRNLDSMMRANPGQTIWSVSNNDNYNVCTCPACRHSDSLYGGPSGTLIHFINQVARRFPDKTISTLGYQFTRRPPRQDCAEPQQPDSNVSIMFCSIECGRQLPIADAAGEQSFRDDMEGWSKICDNIFMWDYVVQFRNFWDPFPNLHVIKPNLHYFHDHGVRQMFEQGSGADNKTSWMELRTYLIANLMWDIEADADSIIHDFCLHYYLQAAPFVEAFYREMSQSLIASGSRLDIYGYAADGREGYLSPKQIQRYKNLIQQAYATLKDDSDSALADRIRYLELSLDYAILELAMDEPADNSSQFSSEMIRRADRFVNDCHRFGIEYLHEMGLTVDEYRGIIDGYIRKIRPSLSSHHTVTLLHPYDPRYPALQTSDREHLDLFDGQALTDGVAGILNYSRHWLGFYDNDLEAVIDLGNDTSINDVCIDFYFFPLSWIFLPKDVSIQLSSDGQNWREVWSESITNPELLATPAIHSCQASNLAQHARYVKVVAHRLPSIPDWHRAVGNPCWMFTDEIIVNGQ